MHLDYRAPDTKLLVYVERASGDENTQQVC